jgi:hypothetical protein
MAVQQHQTDPQPELEYSSFGSFVLRFFWMVLGNVALVLCAALVAKGTAPIATSVAFFAIAIGLIVVRYVDIVRFKGDTSEGKPATLTDWRRYTVRLAVIAPVLWALARLTASRGWMM